MTNLPEIISNVRYYKYHGYNFEITDTRITITRQNGDDWQKVIEINPKIRKAITEQFFK